MYTHVPIHDKIAATRVATNVSFAMHEYKEIYFIITILPYLIFCRAILTVE